MEHGVVNAREVATAAWLMLLGSKGEGVYIDTGIGVAAVVLVGLDNVEVRSFTLREAILAVELELGGDDGVLAPTVHVQSGLGKHEGTSITDKGARDSGCGTLGSEGGFGQTISSGTNPVGRVVGSSEGAGTIKSTGHLEKTRCVDEGIVTTTNFVLATEGVDGIGKGIDGVSVVEGLGTKSAEENASGIEGGTVVNVGIGLDNPDKLLAGVVEVELDLVGR